MWRKPVSGRRANPLAELTLESVYRSSGKEKESCCLVFPSSTKHEIRRFHFHSCCSRAKKWTKKLDARA